ncbi:MAG: universal stress protein [Acidobacteriota bacterium]
MSEPVAEFVVRRILVALDASTQSLAALKTAVTLAAELGADLEGLFVEDINLMRVAMLPVARRILYPTGTEEPFDSSHMERELKLLARQAQESLATLAERFGIRWSFRVARGKVNVEILAAASESDLLTVGRSGWSLARRMQLGSTAQDAAINAPKALLLVKRPLAIDRPVMTVFDGSPLSEQVLKAATHLASAFQSRLAVLLIADSPQNARKLERQAARIIKLKAIPVKFRPIYTTDTLYLADAVESEAGGLVVLGRRYEQVSENEIQNLIRMIGNPVLLVR